MDEILKPVIGPDGAFQFGGELIKSVGAKKDGRWIFEGIAADENIVDLQNEVVMTTGKAFVDGLSFFKSWGKFNYDHREGPENLIGEPIDAQVLEDGRFWVKGWLYKGVERARHIWNLLESDAKLGFSVQGSILGRGKVYVKSLNKEVNAVTKSFIRKVAITEQPVNGSTWCSLAKSLFGSDEMLKGLTTETGAMLIPEDLEKDEKYIDLPRTRQALISIHSSLDGLHPDDAKRLLEFVGSNAERLAAITLGAKKQRGEG